MFENKITKIFESTTVSEYLTLKKVDLDDATFMKLLSLKPGEINIVLARVASFIRNDAQDKSRKDLINDCLEVLERSASARAFVGIGLNENYNLFKGFPVRKGDPYENMPDVGEGLTLQPKEVFIGWETDATTARTDGTKYDASKGEPIGGLLVETTVDSTKILFDVNAVVRTCQNKLTLINQYNAQAAPGKSISKSNTDFLGTKAPIYHGLLEIVTNNKIVNTRVIDKWMWTNNDSGGKIVHWLGNEKGSNEPNMKQPQETPAQQQPTPSAAEPSYTPPTEQVQETLHTLFEKANLSKGKDKLTIDEFQLDEDFSSSLRNIGNWISKTSAFTVRGMTLKYFELLIKQYESQKEVYRLAAEYAEQIDDHSMRKEYAAKQMEYLDVFIEHVKDEYRKIQNDPKAGVSFADVEGGADQTGHNVSLKKESVLKNKLRMLYELDETVLDEAGLPSVKPRVSASSVQKTFNKLIKAMKVHYDYRIEALKLQQQILEKDLKGYVGGKFEKLPSVQKLKGMLDYTKQCLKWALDSKHEFENNSDKAFDFTFSNAPKESKIDKSQAMMADKAQPVESEPEPPKSGDQEQSVDDVINKNNAGFSKNAFDAGKAKYQNNNGGEVPEVPDNGKEPLPADAPGDPYPGLQKKGTPPASDSGTPPSPAGTPATPPAPAAGTPPAPDNGLGIKKGFSDMAGGMSASIGDSFHKIATGQQKLSDKPGVSDQLAAYLGKEGLLKTPEDGQRLADDIRATMADGSDFNVAKAKEIIKKWKGSAPAATPPAPSAPAGTPPEAPKTKLKSEPALEPKKPAEAATPPASETKPGSDAYSKLSPEEKKKVDDALDAENKPKEEPPIAPELAGEPPKEDSSIAPELAPEPETGSTTAVPKEEPKRYEDGTDEESDDNVRVDVSSLEAHLKAFPEDTPKTDYKKVAEIFAQRHPEFEMKKQTRTPTPTELTHNPKWTERPEYVFYPKNNPTKEEPTPAPKKTKMRKPKAAKPKETPAAEKPAEAVPPAPVTPEAPVTPPAPEPAATAPAPAPVATPPAAPVEPKPKKSKMKGPAANPNSTDPSVLLKDKDVTNYLDNVERVNEINKTLEDYKKTPSTTQARQKSIQDLQKELSTLTSNSNILKNAIKGKGKGFDPDNKFQVDNVLNAHREMKKQQAAQAAAPGTGSLG